MKTTDVINICTNLKNILEQYGNINFLSKEELYLIIDYIRNNFNININEVFNVPNFCQNNFSELITYDFHNFKSNKIGGFLVKNTLPEKSFITINSSKERISMLFDLTHEMIHFLLHPENRRHYISSSLCDIDNFEWQANEGAAELLVPYKKFIPIFVKNIKNCNTQNDYIDFLTYLSDKYTVSTAVLEYRLSGLKYEIEQYEKGIPIENIEFLSKRAQEERGIFITSYNDIYMKHHKKLKFILSKNSNNSIEKFENQPIQNKVNTLSSSFKSITTWTEFLSYLKDIKKVFLYINLLNTELILVNDTTVSINFVNGISNLCKAIIERNDNYELIKNFIYNMFHKNMSIQFVDSTNNNIFFNIK